MNYKEEIEQIIRQTIQKSSEHGAREITCRLTFAKNYREIGFWDTASNSLLPDIDVDFFEGNKIQKIYSDLLDTADKFNRIECQVDSEMNQNTQFTWDQAYYDEDVEGNKKLKKKS